MQSDKARPSAPLKKLEKDALAALIAYINARKQRSSDGAAEEEIHNQIDEFEARMLKAAEALALRSKRCKGHFENAFGEQTRCFYNTVNGEFCGRHAQRKPK